MKFSPIIENLIQSLCCLPGIGPKSAQRIAFYLLEKNKTGALNIAKSIETAVHKISNCKKCRILCDSALCNICTNNNRDTSLLCVVEHPIDVISIEQTSSYNGLYFVLLGKLSPIDGVGPHNIGIELFKERLQNEAIKEIIMATNTTIEGEATAYYLSDLAKNYNISVTRLAHGIPLGGELEYTDTNTISRAIATRRELV